MNQLFATFYPKTSKAKQPLPRSQRLNQEALQKARQSILLKKIDIQQELKKQDFQETMVKRYSSNGSRDDKRVNDLVQDKIKELTFCLENEAFYQQSSSQIENQQPSIQQYEYPLQKENSSENPQYIYIEVPYSKEGIQMNNNNQKQKERIMSHLNTNSYFTAESPQLQYSNLIYSNNHNNSNNYDSFEENRDINSLDNLLLSGRDSSQQNSNSRIISKSHQQCHVDTFWKSKLNVGEQKNIFDILHSQKMMNNNEHDALMNNSLNDKFIKHDIHFMQNKNKNNNYLKNNKQNLHHMCQNNTIAFGRRIRSQSNNCDRGTINFTLQQKQSQFPQQERTESPLKCERPSIVLKLAKIKNQFNSENPTIIQEENPISMKNSLGKLNSQQQIISPGRSNSPGKKISPRKLEMLKNKPNTSSFLQENNKKDQIEQKFRYTDQRFFLGRNSKFIEQQGGNVRSGSRSAKEKNMNLMEKLLNYTRNQQRIDSPLKTREKRK